MMSVKATIPASIGFTILLASALLAQPQLPQAEFVAGWQTQDTVEHYGPEELFGYIDGGAEVYLEFGFTMLSVQRYVNGDEEIELNLYEMGGPEAALGIYKYNVAKETAFKEIPARNSGSSSQITIVRGGYFIQINSMTGSAAILPAMLALAQKTLANIPAGKPVGLLSFLPKAGLVPNSERVFRGPLTLRPIFVFGVSDVLLLNGRVFGVAGDYSDKDGKMTRIVISYTDTNAAKEAFESFSANLDPRLKVTSKSATSLMFEDEVGKFGRVSAEGAVIRIVVNSSVKPAPASLRN
jgi:hypothetical protein